MSLSATVLHTTRTPHQPLQHLGGWLRSGLMAAACCASLGLAHAEERSTPAKAPPVSAIESRAVDAQMADVATTGVGLLLGAAEANPLGLLTLGFKAIAHQNIKNSPTVEQPRLWSMYGALGWGAAANNLCVIAAIATGGGAAVLCPLIGLGAGIGSWNAKAEERDKATFGAICQEAKSKNPKMVCIYNTSKT
jgi:hypothetical protein